MQTLPPTYEEMATGFLMWVQKMKNMKSEKVATDIYKRYTLLSPFFPASPSLSRSLFLLLFFIFINVIRNRLYFINNN